MNNKTRITIGVGCGLRKNREIINLSDRMQMIRKAKTLLLSSCGGYTMTAAEGGWRDGEGNDWEEPSLGFVTIVDEGAIMPDVLAAAIRDIFEQACVMLTTEPVNTKLI